MLIVWFFAYKKLAQFAARCALPPRRSESLVCATDNKPSCVLHLLGWFILGLTVVQLELLLFNVNCQDTYIIEGHCASVS